MKIAVLSDIHGNALALEAVLRDMNREAIYLIINLGDTVSGPFEPARSADLQMAMNAITIAGNHERQLLTGHMGESDQYASKHLSKQHWDWLATMPREATLLGGRIFACHGSPKGGDLDYFLDNVSNGHANLDTTENIRNRVGHAHGAELILCGHTHIPRIVQVDNIVVVNPGSVGMPAYDDITPVTHVMEAGSPHARYALIQDTPTGWAIELRAILYDFEAAALQAEQAGRPEVAFGVRTGRMP